MKKIILLFLSCFVGFNAVSQNEASNWYFGENAGINFDFFTGQVTSLDGGQINTREGCASISDVKGDLLFYTDGKTVYNKFHDVMTNGRNLLGDESSTQSAIVVPKPNDPNLYYIFTVGSNATNTGLNYSIVDASANSGAGEVTTKNVNLLRNCAEKISAVVKDCDTKSIWVLTLSTNNGVFPQDAPPNLNTFYAYEINDTGIVNTPIRSNFPINIFDGRGYLKLSPDGEKLACANAQSGLFLFDFDSQSGVVSNSLSLNINTANNIPYGVEFSPNSQFLYILSSNDFFDRDNVANNENASNHRADLTQFDLNAPSINNSQILLDSRQQYRGALQLAPDGKIYRSMSRTYLRGLNGLGVINNPNVKGAGANYQHNAVRLGSNNSTQGLPPFISSFFNQQMDIINNGQSGTYLSLCEDESYTLVAEDIPGAKYTWTLDGNPLPSTGNTHIINPGEEGRYKVVIEPNGAIITSSCGLPQGEANVQFFNNPIANDHTILQCDEDGDINGFTLFNLNEANINISESSNNIVTRFYTDLARTQETDGNFFENTSNPQTIYVEVFNEVTECTSYSELTLMVSTTDTNDTTLDACDDDGNEDGFYEFNLREADSDITNNLPGGLDISYFKTYEDALLERDNLGDTFKNTIPFTQTIYARVENANNCYGISEVLLNIKELPDIDTEDHAYYCLNSYPAEISINAGLLNGRQEDFTYAWSTGEDSYSIQINEPGTYSVLVTNTEGCSKERIVTVEASNVAEFGTPPYNIVDISANNIVTVLISEKSEGSYQYALYDETNNTKYRDFQDSNVFENVYPGIYTIRVNDVKNDCGTTSKSVSVIGFPKFFTPNDDGVHDTWQILGVSSMFQPSTKVRIFDRYGKLIKEISPLGEGWDGLFNGEKLPSDDYWFVVRLQDGRIFKNHFTLKY